MIFSLRLILNDSLTYFFELFTLNCLSGKVTSSKNISDKDNPIDNQNIKSSTHKKINPVENNGNLSICSSPVL